MTWYGVPPGFRMSRDGSIVSESQLMTSLDFRDTSMNWMSQMQQSVDRLRRVAYPPEVHPFPTINNPPTIQHPLWLPDTPVASPYFLEREPTPGPWVFTRPASSFASGPVVQQAEKFCSSNPIDLSVYPEDLDEEGYFRTSDGSRPWRY